jgi:DNA (cytosine-5)-methyltransferase 3A
MKQLRVLSLFDGISCLRVALGDRPIDYYGAAEIDINAIAVSMNNWDDITPLGDVCTLKGIENIDLLCGGSPCTDLSIAKKDREGLKGDHSKLFYEFVRILKETKPRYFLLENVASMRPADKDIISAELGVQPIMIDAALVSAQSRKRLFWTNIPVKGLPEDRNITLKDILQTDVGEEYYTKSTAKTTIKKENNAFNQVGYVGAKNACGVGGQALRIYDTNKKAPTSGVGLYQVGVSIRAHKIGEEWVDKVEHRKDDKVSALTTTFAGKLALIGELEQKEVKRIRKLTPVECERLQSLPDNYTDCISKTQRYRCLGNAFNVEVIKFILSFMPEE